MSTAVLEETALGTLKAARALLADKERWTQGAYARDKDGCTTAITSEDAHSFCLAGALYRCGKNHAVHEARAKLARASGVQSPFNTVSTFNDREYRKHEDILKLLDDAIEAATPKG